MIQVFVFNILSCFDMFEIFFSDWLGWAFRQANWQTKTHIYSTSTSKYCNMSSKPERAYPTLWERRSFQSIKYQFTPDPNSFLRFAYLRGKYILLIFQLYLTKTFQTKMKRSRGYDPRSLKRWYHTLNSQIYMYTYCSVYIYTVI